jgi:large subunit ribosomal protein L35
MILRNKGDGGLAGQAEFAGPASGYPVAGNQRLGYTGRGLIGQGKSCLRAKIGGDGDRFRRNEKKMPKLKTHTGAKKRFSKTGTGKIKRGQTKTGHILTSKPPKVKRKLGRTLLVSDGDYAKVARMIPYA